MAGPALLHRRNRVALLWAALPSAVESLDFPPGVLSTECRPRAFWILIDQTFLGQKPWQLQAENGTGRWYTITERIASQSGIAITRDLYGNLEIRTSLLAAPVLTKDDLNFDLTLRLLVSSQTTQETYKVSMSCNLTNWSTREVVCEENYIEISVRRIMTYLVKDTTIYPPVPAAPKWKINFQFQNDTMRSMTALEAANWGYGVRTTSTRVVLWAPHNTSMSYIVPTGGLHLAVTMSVMTYSQPWVTVLVITNTACATDPPIFTATSLTWAMPFYLAPLVLDETSYSNENVTMGVNGKLIEEGDLQNYTYHLVTDGSISVTVPIGAPGGLLQSDIQDNTYGFTYSIHLMLERNWLGIDGDTSKHTTYRAITTPYLPQPLVFINYTIPRQKYFNVSLGNFFPDVVLSSLTIGGQLLSRDQAASRGFVVTVVPSGVDSVFLLTVPFEDPLVEQMLLSKWLRQYTLYITYTLTLVTRNRTFTYTDVVRALIEDDVPPTYIGSCGMKSLILDMTHGTMDRYWVPYIRDIPLTVELSASQKYTVYDTATTFHLEVPVLAVGLVYEEINLQMMRVRLDFFLKDNQTLAIMDSFSVTCNFTTGKLLVCFPNGTMMATILSSDTVPGLDARRTHLRDKTCLPTQANSTMALFTFSAKDCGTTRWFDGRYMWCENDIIYDKEMIPSSMPSIARDPDYKLTVRCRYPISQSQRVQGKQLGVQIQRGAQVGSRAARNVLDEHQRMARDSAAAHTNKATEIVSEVLGAEDVAGSKYPGGKQG